MRYVKFLDSRAAGANQRGVDDVTISVITPLIALADNGTQVAAANVAEATTTHILHQSKLTITAASATLTGITCTTAGGYDAADLTNLKVRYSTDATLDAGDATVSTLLSPGAAGNKTFPSVSQGFPIGTGYLFITADLTACSASGGNTISLNALAITNLTFSIGSKSGSTNAGGTQTITAATPSVTLADNGTITAANVLEGTINHVLLKFQLSTTAAVNVTGMDVTASGLYDAADLTNLKVRYSTDATLDGADATLSTLTSPGTAGTKTFPSFSTQALACGGTGYFFITADIASGAASGGKTVSASITTGNITTSSGSKTGTATAGGTQTIIPPTPEINLLGNGSSILDGDATPSPTDHTDFGSVAWGATFTRTFTIENTGSAALTLSGSTPFMTISGANAAEFSITTAPSSSIAASGGSTTFVVTFTPGGAGTRSATLTITNNDANEGTYDFAIQGTGTPNALSTLITNTNFSYTANIPYISFQTSPVPALATSSVGVHHLILTDGADADNLPTILSSLGYTYTGTANTILAAALFTTANTKITDATTVGANSFSFTGLSGTDVTAIDGLTTELILRVTFNTTVTDNEKLVFTVSSAAVAGGNTSSLLASFGAVSDNNAGNDNNRIEVAATVLAFVQQPSTTTTWVDMSPSPTVLANDANNNRDLDYVTSVSITSTGSLSATPQSTTPASGLASFGTINHTATATGRTLTATSGSLTSATSGTFDITSVSNGSYRTTSLGTWAGATWERLISGVWTSNPAPATNTSDFVYIRHAITASSVSPQNMVVENAGTFRLTAGCTVGTSLLIQTGGTVQANFTLTVNGTFEIEDGGELVINYSTASGSSAIWGGTENFHPNSTVTIQKWDAGAGTEELFTGSNVTLNTYNGYIAAFGNIDIDLISDPGNSWYLIANNVSTNLAHGNLHIYDIVGQTITVGNTGTVASGIGGDFVLESTLVDNVNLKTSGTMNFTIKGNFEQNAVQFRVFTSSTNGTSSTLTIEGDLVIFGGRFYLNSTSSGNTALATVNLKGDLLIATAGTLRNTNTAGLANNAFNFTGTGDGTSAALTQAIDIASTSVNENLAIPFFIKSGAYVQIQSQNFQLGDNTSVTVESGGVFDFGFSGSTALNVTEVGGTTSFENQAGGTLKITSPNGITTAGATGNVQVDTRTYTLNATYHYIGKANQVTGNGLSTLGSTAGGKRVIAELNSAALSLVPTATTNIGNGDTLIIRQGIVDETAAAYFQAQSGESGNLKMTGGTYRIEATSVVVPRIVGENATYQLTGGTIELDGATAQQLRGLRTYYNLTSVTNNTKTLSGGNITVNALLTLTNGVVTTGSYTVVMPAGSSVARTNGWVHGYLQKNFATGSSVAHDFEVGDATVYAPISVTFASVTGAGDVTASTTAGDHASLATSRFVNPKTVNRTWTLTNSATTFTTYSVVPTWVAGDQDASFAPANSFGGRYDGTTWTYPTRSNRNATNLTLSGIASFGASGCSFQVGSCLVTLTQSTPVSDPCHQGIGSVTLTASDGTPNYTLTWPQTGGSPASGVILNAGNSYTATITGLTGGVTYEFTATDAEGCIN